MIDMFDIASPPETLEVKVTPKAKSARIKKELRDDGSFLYRVYVTVAAEDGKANEAVIQLLAKAFGLPKSKFQIIRGHKTREKVIKIQTNT